MNLPGGLDLEPAPQLGNRKRKQRLPGRGGRNSTKLPARLGALGSDTSITFKSAEKTSTT